METKTLLETVKEHTILLDGGMGTMLFAKGLKHDQLPEQWNLTHPEIIRDIHHEYIQAGSQAILTNTFGGSSIKLADRGLEKKVEEINQKAATIARSAGPDNHFVIGDIGPVGKFLEPFGEISETDLRNSMDIQITALVKGGVDALIFETQMDIREALIGIETAKNITSLPIIVSFTFNKTEQGYFTIMGNSVADAIKSAETTGADIIGTNCSLNSHEMKDLIKEISTIASKPIYAKANAGKPEVTAGRVTYAQTVDDYIKDMPDFLNNGVKLIGGCCGTNPSFISALNKLI